MFHLKTNKHAYLIQFPLKATIFPDDNKCHIKKLASCGLGLFNQNHGHYLATVSIAGTWGGGATNLISRSSWVWKSPELTFRAAICCFSSTTLELI